MHQRRTILGVLLLPGLSGCDSSTGPARGTDGTWVLRSVAESPLPTPVFSDEIPLLLLSDTLKFGILNPYSTGLVIESNRRMSYSGESPTRSTSHYSYERTGSEITIHLVCPPNALCVPDNRHGVIDGGVMTLEYVPSSFGPEHRSPLLYERVR